MIPSDFDLWNPSQNVELVIFWLGIQHIVLVTFRSLDFPNLVQVNSLHMNAV